MTMSGPSSRDEYIKRLATRIMCGGDIATCTDGEYAEAVEWLRRTGIQLPEEEQVG